ncbi:cytidylate kinase Cmk [Thermoclostridium stercorarium subsp. stercorarium DSM 8532]|uniref:Cytidylate kinase n=3 Tax=Thermoclostridium stercorarium TaxID=1510 RepID=L7VP97_THES1|nr:(d)CMP kinase [Thermoclostridium stercorarium]AGC68499.1 cytidylate kinase Cmk [Thermoclostridium stercorarium subsp. stercorarium DSM 8532]AGI39517.1 cytidylate kinase [Thermoclostridium stercorarium subsp. stercorarium DSM 8532]
MRKHIQIAIDGPSGAGKSTMAKIVAKKLGIMYLDTGAMYRAVALKAIKSGIDTKDGDALAEMVKDIDLRIVYENGAQKVLLDGEDVTEEIRTPAVTVGSSNVAVNPAVREKMVELQQKIAKENSVVMDGRDIGTHVLPNADVKIFLTASIEERAKRRYEELREKGMLKQTFEELKKEMEYRDINDSTRSHSPLKKADDAILLDTTGFSLEEAAKVVLNIIKSRL